MPTHRLTSIYGGFRVRTDSLLDEFLVAAPHTPREIGSVSLEVVLRHSRAYLVNRLFHLWSEYCRQVIVASTLGNCQTLNGITLTRPPHIKNIYDILSVIRKKHIAGPGLRWGDPSWTFNNLRKIQPANIQQISLGIGSAPYDDLRHVRNFIIHSNSLTRREFNRVALRYSLFDATPDDLLFYRLPGGGTLMEYWVRVFQFAALDTVR